MPENKKCEYCAIYLDREFEIDPEKICEDCNKEEA